MAEKLNSMILGLKNNQIVLVALVLVLTFVFNLLGLNILLVVLLDVIIVVGVWRLSLLEEDDEHVSQIELLFDGLKENIAKIALASTAVANGEVGAKMPTDIEDDLGVVSSNMTSLVDAILHIIKEIDDMSDSSATTSRELESITTTTAKVMNDLSATLQELTSTTLQINSSVEDISEGGANEIDELTKEGMERLSQLENRMLQIKEDSGHASRRIMALNQSASEMDNIIDAIQGIAKQTNLLALNAAIEAARAGESGKGFAVVADEVRKLAASTQSSLEDIGNLIDEFTKESSEAVAMINANNKEVEVGKGLLDETTSTFKVIASRITSMVGQVKESSYATAQIASGSQEIASAATVQSESIEQIHGLSKALATMSTDMKDTLSNIQVGGSELELDLEEFDKAYQMIGNKEKTDLIKEFDLDGCFIIGMIARLEPNKGHDFFLSGVTKVLDSHQGACVVIAGNGSLDHTLQAKVDKLGYGHRIKMVGYRSDVMTILSILDMVVATSIKEGTPPRILLEAMAASKPIVSTDVIGAKAIIKHSQHGLLVPHGDVEGLVSAMNKMIDKKKKSPKVWLTKRESISKH